MATHNFQYCDKKLSYNMGLKQIFQIKLKQIKRI